MSLEFVNIYNSVAEQAWSMYDADAETVEDFETGLKSSINKALTELWCSYEFPFRVKTYTIKTKNGVHAYNMPTGNIISKTVNGTEKYLVKIGNEFLEYSDELDTSTIENGKPTKFQVYGDKLLLNKKPTEAYTIDVEYLELAIGYSADGDKIYELSEDEDYISVPDKLEKLFKNALITKSMLYAIADKSDENYAGYLEQYENAYKTLIKYSIGIEKDKRVII